MRFTKAFFELPAIDQCLFVEKEIADIEARIGRHVNAAGDHTARQQIEAIRRKAVEYGVWAE